MRQNLLSFILIIAVATLLSQNAFAQSYGVGIGITTPNPSAILDLSSSQQGFLIPRMTQGQRDLIANPATGLLIYQVNGTAGFYYYNGGWQLLNPSLAAYANTTLSNLGITAINAGLLPSPTNTYNLGSTPNAWRSLFLDGHVFMGGNRFISYQGTGNCFVGSIAGLNNTSGNGNTAVGHQSLTTNIGGVHNTAVGYQAANQNIGNYNSAFGSSALLSNTTGYNNTGIGSSSLFTNTTGYHNVAVGAASMQYNTQGSENVAVGFIALSSNSLGARNVAVGKGAMYANTTGIDNVGLGYQALYSNIDGHRNTAVGASALGGGSSGSDNTANGYAALFNNSSGERNVATGTSALYNNGVGNNNVATGFEALTGNTSGTSNVAAGYRSLYSNTMGNNNVAAGQESLSLNLAGNDNTAYGHYALRNSNGDANVAIGSFALLNNTSGIGNIAMGYNALSSNNSGNSNLAIGGYALGSNTSGNGNVAMGDQALNSNVSATNNSAFGNFALYVSSGINPGNNNSGFGYSALTDNPGASNVGIGHNTGGYATTQQCTFVGAGATPGGAAVSNSTALGFQTVVNASNAVRVGNVSVTSIGGFENWSNISDGRFKKNIVDNVPGLRFINRLHPVTYNLDVDGIVNALESGLPAKAKDRIVSQHERTARQHKSGVLYTGFLAQEVEAAAKEINYNFSGVDAPKNERDLYGLRYSEFVVPLVKAVQELSKKNEDQQREIDELKQLVKQLVGAK